MEQRGERPMRPHESGKRKYEPPEILSEQVFETTALACAKMQGQGFPCSGNRKS